MAQTLQHPGHPEHPALRDTDWSAGVWAGLIAGAVFLVAELSMVMLIQGESPWGPPRMMAAIVLGKGVLPPPATFDLMIVAVAMGVHFALSIAYGVAIGWIVRRFHAGAALAIGAALGLAIYRVNFYPIARRRFPGLQWHAAGLARSPMSFSAAWRACPT